MTWSILKCFRLSYYTAEHTKYEGSSIKEKLKYNNKVLNLPQL